ncbi:MAG: gliding motility-associated C-terminal domain-containing protein [Reichenbachiella sp.]|uniref:T9SS type B sorting domain-containing protein n=1 Tax=Reichenbachiella sp. TaxID=2184521 RepID=UPI003265587D
MKSNNNLCSLKINIKSRLIVPLQSGYIFLRLLLLLFCLNGSLKTYSQSSFLRSIGDSQDQEASIVKVGSDVFAFGIQGTNPSLFVSKLDANLLPIWTKTYSSNNALHRDFVLLPDGNLLFSGLENNNFSTSLIKIDEDGNVLLSQSYGSFADRLKNLLVSSDGFIYHSGELEGLVSGRNKVTVQKLNSNLEPQWGFYLNYEDVESNVVDSEAYERDMVELSDGSLILVFTYSNISGTNRKIRLAKFNSDGDVEWVKGYNGGIYDLPQRMVRSDEDDLYIVSTSSSFSPQLNILLTKVDSNGNHLWSKEYQYAGDQNPVELIIDSNDNIVLTGNTTSGTPFWMGINLEGVLQFAYQLETDEQVQATKIIEYDPGYIISGSISDGDEDVLLIRLDENGELTTRCISNILGNITTNSVNLTTVNLNYTKTDISVAATSSLTTNTLTYTDSDIECKLCNQPNYLEYNFCEGEFVELDYSIYGSDVEWNDGSTLKIRKLYDQGFYWVEYTNSGCLIRDEIELIVASVVPDFTLGNDITFCTEGTIIPDLISNPSFTYNWSTGSNQENISVSESGEYWCKVTGECNSNSDTIIVTVIDPINYEPLEDTFLCKGDLLNLTLPNEYNYEWSNGSFSSYQIFDSEGNYWVEISTVCQSIVDNFSISFNPEVPSFSLGNDTTICTQGIISPTLDNEPSFSYTWNVGSNQESISVTESGQYWCRVSGECNSMADTISVEVIPPIVYSAINDTLICNVDEYRLDLPKDYNYLWSTGSVSSEEQFESNGMYWVEISTYCETVYNEFEVKISNTKEIILPNAFSPNSDGINDFFELPEDLSGSDFTVINRYGKVLYKSGDYQNDWNGKELESGNYFILISHICLEKDIKGSLNILK